MVIIYVKLESGPGKQNDSKETQQVWGRYKDPDISSRLDS